MDHGTLRRHVPSLRRVDRRRRSRSSPPAPQAVRRLRGHRGCWVSTTEALPGVAFNEPDARSDNRAQHAKGILKRFRDGGRPLRKRIGLRSTPIPSRASKRGAGERPFCRRILQRHTHDRRRETAGMRDKGRSAVDSTGTPGTRKWQSVAPRVGHEGALSRASLSHSDRGVRLTSRVLGA
jgi:hypothetical protein